MTKTILVHGDPIGGLHFTGPFDSAQDAADYAEQDRNVRSDTWWTPEMEVPGEMEEALNAAPIRIFVAIKDGIIECVACNRPARVVVADEDDQAREQPVIITSFAAEGGYRERATEAAEKLFTAKKENPEAYE